MSDEPKKKVRINKRNANNVLASTFCESSQFERKLVYFTTYDAFFYYTDNKYFKKLTSREFDKILLRFCETQFPGQGFTSSQLRDINSLIKLKINREAERENTALIAFNDCLYNIRTHKTIPFSVDKLVTWYLPYDLADIKMETPIFKSFLETSLVECQHQDTPDFELINLVQEMLGYLMMDTFYATGAFFLYGTGANGKSVLSLLIESIFGDEYSSAMSLSDFNRPFAVGDIINKRVNISNEEDEKFISSKMFKVLITGESLRGEHKFGDGYKMKSTCKFLFSTNKLPTFDGLDYGLKRRVFLIPFYRIFSPYEQDKFLLDKLKKEIPGIIGWAIEGAKRLADNNYVFSESKASKLVFSEFEEEMSGAVMFFNENYVIDNEFRTSKAQLYDHYVDWIRSAGKKNYSKQRFTREINDNIEGLDGNLYGSQGGVSFRAFNCRFSNRDERGLPEEDEAAKKYQGKIIN